MKPGGKIAILIVSILVTAGVGIGIYFAVKSKQKFKCPTHCANVIVERDKQSMITVLNKTEMANVFLKPSEIERLKQVISELFDNLLEPFCKCFDTMKVDFAGSGPECYQYKPSDAQRICLMNNLTWKQMDSAIKYGINELLPQLLTETNIKLMLSMDRSEGPLLPVPPPELTRDAQEVLLCVYEKIKQNYPTPKEFVLSCAAAGQQSRTNISALKALIKPYIVSCFTNKTICTRDVNKLTDWLLAIDPNAINEKRLITQVCANDFTDFDAFVAPTQPVYTYNDPIVIVDPIVTTMPAIPLEGFEATDYTLLTKLKNKAKSLKVSSTTQASIVVEPFSSIDYTLYK